MCIDTHICTYTYKGIYYCIYIYYIINVYILYIIYIWSLLGNFFGGQVWSKFQVQGLQMLPLRKRPEPRHPLMLWLTYFKRISFDIYIYSYFVYSYIYKRIQCFGYEIIICSDIKNHCYYRYGVDCSYLTNYPPVSQQLDPGRGLKISFHAKLVIFRVYVNFPEGNSSNSHYNDK